MSAQLTPTELEVVVGAIRQWQQGLPEPAKDSVRPIADRGVGAAQALMAWFLHQQGDPVWRQAIPYARGAVEGGYPQAAGYVVGNMLNDPALVDDALAIASLASAQGHQVLDPIGQAINFAQQANDGAAGQMLTTPWPLAGLPTSPESWTHLVSQAQAALSQVQGVAGEAAQHRNEVISELDVIIGSARDTSTKLQSQSKQLFEMINAATNAQAATFFEAEAATSKTEANTTWRVGVGVFVFAACIAVIPLIAHYVAIIFGVGSELEDGQLVSAHITATVALATLAGILLARSRTRDRNRQRNTDLSVGLKTMIAYGTQIENPDERQRFMHELGRTVIEGYLRQEPSADDGSNGLVSSLVNR